MPDLYLLFGEALASPSEEMFVAEYATSSIFDPDPDGPEPDYDAIVSYLRQVWTAAHITVREIRERTGLSQAAFAAMLCIPKRTLENWESTSATASRACPPYVRLMLAQICGIVDLIHI